LLYCCCILWKCYASFILDVLRVLFDLHFLFLYIIYVPDYFNILLDCFDPFKDLLNVNTNSNQFNSAGSPRSNNNSESSRQYIIILLKYNQHLLHYGWKNSTCGKIQAYKLEIFSHVQRMMLEQFFLLRNTTHTHTHTHKIKIRIKFLQ